MAIGGSGMDDLRMTSKFLEWKVYDKLILHRIAQDLVGLVKKHLGK